MSEAEIVAANSAIGGQTCSGAEVFDQCCCQGGCLRSINENTLIKARFKELQQSIKEAPMDKKAEYRFEMVKDWLCDSQGDDWAHHRELKTLGGIRLCQSAASVILLCCKKTVRGLISWVKEGNEHPKRDGRTCRISQESPEARTANLMLAWAPCLTLLHVCVCLCLCVSVCVYMRVCVITEALLHDLGSTFCGALGREHRSQKKRENEVSRVSPQEHERGTVG